MNNIKSIELIDINNLTKIDNLQKLEISKYYEDEFLNKNELINELTLKNNSKYHKYPVIIIYYNFKVGKITDKHIVGETYFLETIDINELLITTKLQEYISEYQLNKSNISSILDLLRLELVDIINKNIEILNSTIYNRKNLNKYNIPNSVARFYFKKLNDIYFKIFNDKLESTYNVIPNYLIEDFKNRFMYEIEDDYNIKNKISKYNFNYEHIIKEYYVPELQLKAIDYIIKSNNNNKKSNAHIFNIILSDIDINKYTELEKIELIEIINDNLDFDIIKRIDLSNFSMRIGNSEHINSLDIEFSKLSSLNLKNIDTLNYIGTVYLDRFNVLRLLNNTLNPNIRDSNLINDLIIKNKKIYIDMKIINESINSLRALELYNQLNNITDDEDINKIYNTINKLININPLDSKDTNTYKLKLNDCLINNDHF